MKKRNLGKTKLNIFGSCVTRDIMEYDYRKVFCINEYIARQSIISSLSVPVEFDENDIKLDSTFQTKQLESDLKKNALARLENSDAEYLIIDLIEERFKIGKVANSYITFSNELWQSDIFKNMNLKIYEKKKRGQRIYFRYKDIQIYVNKFFDCLLKKYSQNRIIIHEVYLSDYFIDKTGEKKIFPNNYVIYNHKINSILAYMYGCTKKRIPYANVLSISSKYIADEKHKWGLAPMHFQEEYYKEAMNWLYDSLE